MNRIVKIAGLLLAASINHTAIAEGSQSVQEKLCLEGDASCTFVLLSDASNKKTTVNIERANTPMSPFSTFKITNSLIGLEKGLIRSAEQELTYNQEKYPVQAWWPPVWKFPKYNLSTAYNYSMVPIYRQLATDIGATDMQRFLNNMAYGNQDISSGLDDFWLNKSMKISANEQVNFLQKIYHNKFDFKNSAIKTLKSVMLAEETSDYKLYAKTGAGKVNDGTMLGWYVGFVETKADVYYFAFNFNRENYRKMKADRIQMAKNHLKEAGVI